MMFGRRRRRMFRRGRSPLRMALLAAALLGVGVPTAWATMSVIDTTAIGRLGEQLSRMQEQIDAAIQQIEIATRTLDVLGEVSATIQDTMDAIGKVGQIRLPMLNLKKLSNQLQRDSRCLMPDLERMMPGVRFEDISFASICSARAAYRSTLWYRSTDAEGITWDDQAEARAAIASRREALVRSAVTDGLAHADVAAAAAAEQGDEAAAELERAMLAATTQNDRLAVIAQGQVLAARQQATTNQLLANLLRVQSAALLQSSMPLDGDPRAMDDNEGEGE